jgi:hypothetical protein
MIKKQRACVSLRLVLLTDKRLPVACQFLDKKETWLRNKAGVFRIPFSYERGTPVLSLTMTWRG